MSLPDDRPTIGPRQAVVLAVACYLMMYPVIMGVVGTLPQEWVARINLAAIVVGGALRVLAHDRKEGWKFVDLLGKLIAYFGAFVSIFIFAMQP
nr:hypothetical protein [uncultured Microbacterium sp.]